MSASKKHVIIDTDPGVDDALALILALRSPELSVEAITTVSGNTRVGQCTENALRVLEILGLPDSPPVVQGADKPIRREPSPNISVHGRDGRSSRLQGHEEARPHGLGAVYGEGPEDREDRPEQEPAHGEGPGARSERRTGHRLRRLAGRSATRKEPAGWLRQRS